MMLTLQLPAHVEEKLNDASKQLGLSAEEYAISLLDQHLPVTAEQRAENYRTWLEQVHEEGDSEGECSWDEILQRIDESRGETRKLFPPELKGTTW